ncbi:MAG: TRAP transporter small permease, partial [bacterium]|nr:TRAP transporter small permease [bacterium]
AVPEGASDAREGAPDAAVAVKTMNPVFGVLNTVRTWVTWILAGICLVLFVFLVVVVTWQVFTRQVLNNAAPWTTEAASYTFVVLSLFAAAYVFGERGHIAVEMMVEKFAPAAQKITVVIVELLVIFFVFASFIIGGMAVASGSSNQDIASLPLTVGQVYTVMPVAGGIIIFFSLVHIIGILTGDDVALNISEEMGEAV